MFRLAVTSSSFCQNRDLLTRLKEEGLEDLKLNSSGDRLSRPELVAMLKDQTVAIVGTDTVDDNLLAQCPSLEMISKFGVGIDNIDQEACTRRGVAVRWTAGTNSRSVAEQTLAFMIFLFRNLHCTSRALRSGYWNKSGGSQLSGKTVGILGVGNVGRDLVRLLQPFGCRVIANDLIDQPDFFEKMHIESMTKSQIYREADVVTVHLPLDDSTRGLVTKDTFEAMKSTAFFINTARGGIVVQDDLKRALQSQAIAGAAIDVYESEPPSDLELLEQENLICTPHIGGNAREAVSNMGNAAIDHVVDFLDRKGVR